MYRFVAILTVSLFAIPLSDARKVKHARSAQSIEQCWQHVPALQACFGQRFPSKRRTIGLRVVFAEEYVKRFGFDRVEKTLQCVNKLYEPSLFQFAIEKVDKWKVKDLQFNLSKALELLRRNYAQNDGRFTIGFINFGKRRVYSTLGGKQGVSQASAAIVSAWPRWENDCLTMAHELGHLLGAVHVKGKHWVMTPATYSFKLPVKDPLARVLRHYRFSPINLKRMEARYFAKIYNLGVSMSKGCQRYLSQSIRCTKY